VRKIFFYAIIFASLTATCAFGWVTKTVYKLVPVGLPEINKKDLAIKYVKAQSPAGKAGLELGDEIYRINNKYIYDITKYASLTEELSPGQGIVLEIKRNKKIKKFNIITDENGSLGYDILPEEFWSTVIKDKSIFYIARQAVGSQDKGIIITVKNGNLKDEIGVCGLAVEITNSTDQPVKISPANISAESKRTKLEQLTPAQVLDMEFPALNRKVQMYVKEHNIAADNEAIMQGVRDIAKQKGYEITTDSSDPIQASFQRQILTQTIVLSPDFTSTAKARGIEQDLQEYNTSLCQLNKQIIPNKEIAPDESANFLVFFDNAPRASIVALTFLIDEQEVKFSFIQGEEIK